MQVASVAHMSSAVSVPKRVNARTGSRMPPSLAPKAGLTSFTGRALRVAPARRTASMRPCAAAAPVSASLDSAGEQLASRVSEMSHQLFGADMVAHGHNLMYTLADATAEMDPALAEKLAKNKEGWLAPLSNAMEAFLKVLDGGLESVGVPYSYGFAIILLTLLVKAATLPLSKKQVESSMAMQQLQPMIKELQTKHAGDTERLQMETAALYKTAGVNPLAGCLPTLATLPIWIGLYRALTNVADEGLLTEGFFWIPSLAGPVSTMERDAGSGMSWLFPLVDGAPPIGWVDAGSYLLLPILLIISQFVTTKIMQPKEQSPEAAQANGILKVLPFMIGWFALNVPSGLTLYWFTNNILTTAQQLYLKKTLNVELAMPGAGGGAADPVRVEYGTTAPVTPRSDRFAQLKREEEAAKAARSAATKATSEFASLDSMLGAPDNSPKTVVAEVTDIEPPEVKAMKAVAVPDAVKSEIPSMDGPSPAAAAGAAAGAASGGEAKAKPAAPAGDEPGRKLSRKERRRKARASKRA